MASEGLEISKRDIEVHNSKAIGDSPKGEDRLAHLDIPQLLAATGSECFKFVVD
jgi:hypothetical protein